MIMDLVLAALLAAAPTCITTEDPALKRWVTECRDGSRHITRYDRGLKRFETRQTKPATKGDPHGQTPDPRPQ